MNQIELTQGKFALVDDEDFDFLSQWKWRISGSGYAISGSKSKRVFMHRVINNTPEGYDTDHINRDKLDNRRENLRTATKMLNGRNRGENKNNTSGHKGISWDKRVESWAVYIWKDYKKIHLGRFKILVEAIKARKKGEEMYWI